MAGLALLEHQICHSWCGDHVAVQFSQTQDIQIESHSMVQASHHHHGSSLEWFEILCRHRQDHEQLF
jgi:hypothetical protein